MNGSPLKSSEALSASQDYFPLKGNKKEIKISPNIQSDWQIRNMCGQWPQMVLPLVTVSYILLYLTNLATALLFLNTSPMYKPTYLLGPPGFKLPTSTSAQLSTPVRVFPTATVLQSTVKAGYTSKCVKVRTQKRKGKGCSFPKAVHRENRTLHLM